MRRLARPLFPLCSALSVAPAAALAMGGCGHGTLSAEEPAVAPPATPSATSGPRVLIRFGDTTRELPRPVAQKFTEVVSRRPIRRESGTHDLSAREFTFDDGERPYALADGELRWTWGFEQEWLVWRDPWLEPVSQVWWDAVEGPGNPDPDAAIDRAVAAMTAALR